MNGAYDEHPLVFNVQKLAFLYGDHQYFAWFQNPAEHTLRAVLRWKGLNRTPIWKRLNEIWNRNRLVVGAFDRFPPVTRAFLYHLHEPLEFPILDKYVWLAMRQMAPEPLGRLPMNPDHWEDHYRRRYIPFFNRLLDEHGIEIMNVPQIDDVDVAIVRRRVLDRALWTYGKIIKEDQV
ncbi:MAG: hypothetical protein JW993_07330 [Sedimentisphaerales bacterium]|nr:hypothetical protein [Sedimentisphaerales bacterium]